MMMSDESKKMFQHYQLLCETIPLLRYLTVNGKPQKWGNQYSGSGVACARPFQMTIFLLYFDLLTKCYSSVLEFNMFNLFHNTNNLKDNGSNNVFLIVFFLQRTSKISPNQRHPSSAACNNV